MAYLYAKKAGPKAKVLVDLGHHLPAPISNQIVAWLIDENMLGGFHFNDKSTQMTTSHSEASIRMLSSGYSMK